jgi:transcriptional regulator with XRE-family HTH domain
MVLFVDRSHAFDQAVGARIRRHRVGQELTQQQLADLLQLARTSITNVEGGNQPLSAWLLWRIADILRCTPMDLLPTHAEVPETNILELPNDLTPKSRDVINRLANVSQ